MQKTKQIFKDMSMGQYPLTDTFLYEINSPKRIKYFGNALFDKFALMVTREMNSEDEVMEMIGDSSSGYEDVWLFILPKEGFEDNPIWNRINSLIMGFKAGVDQEVTGMHPMLIATREFENFIVVGLVDNMTYLGEEIESDYQEDIFSLVQVHNEDNHLDYGEVFRKTGEKNISIANNEEGSGSNYFYSFGDIYPEILEYLQEIGICDEQCEV